MFLNQYIISNILYALSLVHFSSNSLDPQQYLHFLEEFSIHEITPSVCRRNPSLN